LDKLWIFENSKSRIFWLEASGFLLGMLIGVYLEGFWKRARRWDFSLIL
jgi:hypothetical protein